MTRERCKPERSTGLARTAHAPDMGPSQTTHGQDEEYMWRGGQIGDPSVDKLEITTPVAQSPLLWSGPRPPDLMGPGSRAIGQNASGDRGQATMGAPGHMLEPGKVLGPGLTGNTTAAPQSFQVNKTFEHKTLTDLVRSDDGRELDEGRVEACERVTDPDPHLHEQGGDSAKGGGGWPPPPRRSKKCSKWWKPRSGMVLRTQEDKEDGPTLEVEEMIDSPAAAWTNTRNSTSTTMLLTLVDNKREAATAAMSFDPDLLIAYVNSSFQESNEEVGEADLLQQGQAERKLRSLTHPEKVLCRNRNIYQWGDSRAAICDVRPTKEERAKTDNYQSREEVIRKQLERIMTENREHKMFTSHKAKPHKRTTVPARTFLYVPCRTTFPYGTTFLCTPLANQELHLLVARCVMARNCPHNLVYVPTCNLTDEDIVLGPDNSLALLEAGDVESVNETELVPGEEGEVQKCGDFTFPVMRCFARPRTANQTSTPSSCPTLPKRNSTRQKNTGRARGLGRRKKNEGCPGRARETPEERRRMDKRGGARAGRHQGEGGKEAQQKKVQNRRSSR